MIRRAETARLLEHDSYLVRTYRIDIHDYYSILRLQGGGCGICRTLDPGKGRRFFNVDHDHLTGAVRGLLCPTCNSAIGKLGDTASGVARALKYLTDPPAQKPRDAFAPWAVLCGNSAS